MKKIFFIISIIFCLTPIFSVMAQETSGDEPMTGFRSILSHDGEQGVSLQVCLNSGCCNLCDAFTVASNIFKFLRNTIAFPVVVLMIIYGGMMMIFSGGSPQRVKNGKKAMSSALIGFAIVWGVSLILNTALAIIAGAPISYQGFINGDLSLVKKENGWDCEKNCGSGSSTTGRKEPDIGKGDIPGVIWQPGVIAAGVNNCIMKAIQGLVAEYGQGNVIVTSLTNGKHKASYHYDGIAADVQIKGEGTGKNALGQLRDFSGKFWPKVVGYLGNQGFTAFCDTNGVRVPCNEATHVHFDMRKISNRVCQ